jgi:hypothetical protein
MRDLYPNSSRNSHKEGHTVPKAFSRIGLIGGLSLAAVVAMAIPAGAAITAPAPNAVILGTVTVSDNGLNSGGTSPLFGPCNGSTTMYVDQNGGTAQGAVVPNGTPDTGTSTVLSLPTVTGSGSSNPVTGTWVTDNFGNGTYTVNSKEVQGHTTIGVFCGSSTSQTPKESVTVNNTGKLVYGGATSGSPGQSVTVKATLTDQNNVAPANGQSVSFSLSGGSLVTGTTTNGVATAVLPITGLPRSATLTVSYGGTYFSSATANQPFTVTQDPTTTTLSPTSSTDFGQTATFTATVVSQVAGQGTPTGSVQFTEDGVNAGSPQPLNGSGVATFTDATLAAGNHTIGAIYGSSVLFATSTAISLTQVVVQAPTSTVLTTSVQPSFFGEIITYTATVTATSPGPSTGAPSGSISFSITPNGGSSQPIGSSVALTPSGTNVSKASSSGVSLLPAGSYTAAASYLPCSPTPCAANFAASSSTTPQTINPAGTSVSIVSTQPVSSFGQSVQFSATVSTASPGHGSPTGSVQFIIDQGTPQQTIIGTAGLNPAGADASSATSPAVSNLTPGLHTVTALYTNTDGNFVSGHQGSLNQFVAPDPSTTVVSTVNNANPSVFGQPVAFQAAVTLQFTDAGTPTGVVLFFINDNNAANCGTAPPADFVEPVVNGVATTPLDASLPVGNDTITACYDSSSSDFGASGTTNPQYVQTVNPDPTTTALTSANSPGNASGPSVWGQPVTFTASVTANAPGAGIPPGTVTFLDGGTALGTVTLSGGSSSNTASLTTSTLSVGSHAIKAVYNPTGPDFLTSNAAIDQVVNQAQTATSVTQNGQSVQGQPVSFTATVTAVAPGAGTPTGTVEFEVNGADIFGGPVAVSPVAGGSEAASPTISSLTPGTYTVTAVYSGDVDFLPSTNTSSQTVGEAATATTLVASPSTSPITFGTPVSLTATISVLGQGAGVPTGSVDFYDGPTLLGSEAVSTVGGVQQATLPATVYGVGSHSFSALYLGEFDFAGSASDSVTQTVGVISTTTSLASSLNPSPYSVPVTFTATVTPSSNAGPGPGGTVTFSDGSTVIGTAPVLASGSHFVATLSESGFAVGTHNVSASYSGSTDYAPSASGTVAQGVTKDGTILVAQASTNTTMTATLTSAQGAPLAGQTLSFSTGTTLLCTAVTAANGTASCTATGLGSLQLVLNGTYTATYAGNASYLGSSSSAKG